MSVASQADTLRSQVRQRAESGLKGDMHPVVAMRDRLNEVTPLVARGLPKIGMSAEEFVACAFQAFRANPLLWKCRRDSVLGAFIKAAFLGLKVDVAGQCWVLPYGEDAQLIIGYRGMFDITMRSPRVAKIVVHEVWPNDLFDVEFAEERVVHRPWYARTDRRFADPGGDHPVYVYCRTWLVHPTREVAVDPTVTVLTQKQVYDRRARSSSWRRDPSKSPWTTDEVPMFLKTAIRAAWRTLPIELSSRQAVEESDETVATGVVLGPETIDVEVVRPDEADSTSPQGDEPEQTTKSSGRKREKREDAPQPHDDPPPTRDEQSRPSQEERRQAIDTCVEIGARIGWSEDRVKNELRGWAALGAKPSEWVENMRRIADQQHDKTQRQVTLPGD